MPSETVRFTAGCNKCSELHVAHARTVLEYSHQLAPYVEAIANNNHSLANELRAAVVEAGERCEQMRREIRQHNAEEHLIKTAAGQ